MEKLREIFGKVLREPPRAKSLTAPALGTLPKLE